MINGLAITSSLLLCGSYAALQSNPELVTSDTGCVTSTPSSMQMGMRGRAKKPNTQRERAMHTSMPARLNTCS